MLSKTRAIPVNFPTILSRGFKLIQFRTGNVQKVGVIREIDGDVCVYGLNAPIPDNTLDLVRRDMMQEAKRQLDVTKDIYPIGNVEILPAIQHMDKIIGIAANYKSFLNETNRPIPTQPTFFSKFSSTIIGPCDSIQISPNAKEVDLEVELAVIIGRKCKNVKADEARHVIFGYTIAQDLTARDWIRSHGFLLGKTMDTFCPIGGVIATKETIRDPHNLEIKCYLNDDLMQVINTNDMVFNVDSIVAYLSNVMTLLPGDLILTGTGSGTGMSKNPPRFLKQNDIIRSECLEICTMTNKVY